MKHLLKKYRTLEEDLVIAQRSAVELRIVHGIDNQAIILVPGFDDCVIQIWKIKKFACKTLKWKWVQSGISVIFAYFPETHDVEYLEIYHKSDQENMDYDFAREYFRDHSSK